MPPSQRTVHRARAHLWSSTPRWQNISLMTIERVQHLFAEQSGVVSRRQVIALGFDDDLVARQLRRREWAKVHPGIYVDHTGEPTWLQKAWAAVLYYWPAALSHESSLHIHGTRNTGRQDDLVHIAVDQKRRVVDLPGVRLHRVCRLSDVIQPNRAPPRLRLEHSLLDVASAAKRNADAIAVLGDACQEQRTTAKRLCAALEHRVNLPRRQFLLRVLTDVAEGVYSVLEHRYLTRVERPHGLPTARRQRRVHQGRSSAYRDVEYLNLATVVELDGRLGHEMTLDRWEDMERDVDSAALGDVTLRVGWKHVEDPCRTAVAVARVLVARGWRGKLTPCSPECVVHVGIGVCPAPGAGQTPMPA